jgi:hypothetical protein
MTAAQLFLYGGAGLFAVLAAVFITIYLTRRVRVVRSFDSNDIWLVGEFRRCNVITDGKKGTGKDLLFAHVIFLRGEPHYSNITYNGLTTEIDISEMTAGTNTYENFIRGDIKKFDPAFNENEDFYISDGGIFLPSQYNTELDKQYPGLPIFYALQRQLYNSNTHINLQSLGRLWIKLREQADCYIRVLRTKDCGDYFIVTARTYDNYNSAAANILPENNEQQRLRRGEITQRRFKIYKHELNYDTRHFRKKLLNEVRQYAPFEEALNNLLRGMKL